jgi:hypothetical protein
VLVLRNRTTVQFTVRKSSPLGPRPPGLFKVELLHCRLANSQKSFFYYRKSVQTSLANNCFAGYWQLCRLELLLVRVSVGGCQAAQSRRNTGNQATLGESAAAVDKLSLSPIPQGLELFSSASLSRVNRSNSSSAAPR